MRETVDCWIDFMKDQDLPENDIVGGIFDGSKLDKDGVVFHGEGDVAQVCATKNNCTEIKHLH